MSKKVAAWFADRFVSKPWVCLALLSILLMTAVMRFGLLDVPLERDEGEYAYGGLLLLQGHPLYENMYSMKLPGIYAAYALLLTLFGKTHSGIHLGLLFINSATIVLLFFIAKRLFNSVAALASAACFAVISISPTVHGVSANAEHFVILLALSGVVLLIHALDENRWSWLIFSSLLFGLCVLMKQHGALFISFGVSFLLVDSIWHLKVGRRKSLTRALIFIVGSMIPYVITCTIFYFTGWFEQYWYWTFEIARMYSDKIPIDMAWSYFIYTAIPIGRAMFPIWIVVAVGLSALIWDKRNRRRSVFVACFTFFSFLVILPGFYFRHHYFILLLPAASLLFGMGVNTITKISPIFHLRTVQNGMQIFLAVICILISIYQQRMFFFQMTPNQASRFVYHMNPFPESIEIARYIKSHTKEADRIAVIGSEPQIYFYSNRRSATGHIYMYPLMDNSDVALKMQKEMIHEIESIRPMFLVLVWVKKSWLDRQDSHKLLLEWYNSYQARYYQLVGIVDIFEDRTLYHWEPNIKRPQNPSFCAILRRRE
ncbi:MAG: glycosyltransferase family 39 protein [Desulfobacterales bacterium]|nr:MAG: glycosyltransferase family 39 protein [Desulfobacterales bacterium]